MLARYLRQKECPVRYAISTAPEDIEAMRNYLMFRTRARHLAAGPAGLPGVPSSEYGQLHGNVRGAHEALMTQHHPADLMALIDSLAEHHSERQVHIPPEIMENLMHDRGAAYLGFPPEMLPQVDARRLYGQGLDALGGRIPPAHGPLMDMLGSIRRLLGHGRHPVSDMGHALNDRMLSQGDPRDLAHMYDLTHDVAYNQNHPWHAIEPRNRRPLADPVYSGHLATLRLRDLMHYGVLHPLLQRGQQERARLRSE